MKLGVTSRLRPARGVLLDRSHPLVRALRFYTCFQELHLTTPGQGLNRALFRDAAMGFQFQPGLTSSPLASHFPSQTGPGLRFAGVSNGGIPVGLPPSLISVADRLTVGIKVRGEGANDIFLTKSAGNLLRTHFDFRFSSTGIIFSTSNGTVSSDTTGYTGGWYTIFGSWDGRSGRLVILDENGGIREIKTTGGSTGPLTNVTELLNIGSLNAGFSTMTGSVEWVGVWNDVLSTEDCAHLGGEPYDLFMPSTGQGLKRPAAWLNPSPKPESITPAIARRRQTWLPPTKPTDRTLELDRQHPLTQGMLICVPFFEGNGTPVDYARNVTPTVSGTPVWDASRGSLAWRARAAGDFLTLGTDGNDIIIPRRRVTVLLIRAKTDTTVRSAALFGLNNTAGDNTAFSAQTGSGTNVITFRWGGSVNMSTNINAALGITDPEAWAFVAGPTEGAHIYRNGIDVGSTHPTAGERQEGPGEAFYLNRLANGGTVTGDLNNYIFFALLDAEWDQAKVRSWVRDPWQFFKKGTLGNATRIVSAPTATPFTDGSGTDYGSDRLARPYQEIDWADPITRDLRWYTALQGIQARPGQALGGATARDLVGGDLLTAQGNGVTAASRPSRKALGASVAFDAAATSFLKGRPNPALLKTIDIPQRGFTLAVKLRVRANQNNSIIIGKGLNISTGDYSLQLGAGTNSGQIRGAFNATPTGNTPTNFTGRGWITAFLLWAGRTGGGAQGALFVEVYDANGAFLDRSQSIFTPEPASDTDGSAMSMGAWQDGNNNATADGFDVEWGGVWFRFLAQAERIRLATEPYRHLKKPITQRFQTLGTAIFGSASQFAPPPAIGGAARFRKPPRGATLNRRHRHARDLIYFMPLNEHPPNLGQNISRTRFYDLMGRFALNQEGSVANVLGSTVIGSVPSRTGWALSFQGENQGALSRSSITAADMPPLLDRSFARITVAAKFRLPVPQTNAVGIFRAAGAAANVGWSLGVSSSGQTNGKITFNHAAGLATASTTREFSDGKFYTAFGQYDGRLASIAIYDEYGSLVERVTATGSLPTDLLGGLTQVTVGALSRSNAPMTGDVEWVGVWDAVLPPGVMSAIAAEPYEMLYSPVERRAALFAPPPPYTPPAPPQALRPRTKPEPGRLLDRSHPLVRTLRCYLPFNEEPRIVAPTGDPIGGRPFRDAISGRFFTNGYNFGLGPSPGNPSRTGPTVHMTGDAAAQINSSETLALDGTRSQPPTLLSDYNVTPITLGLKFGYGTGQGNAHMFGIATASLDRAILQLTPATHLIRFNTGSATVDSVNAYNTTRFYTVFGRMTAPIINSFPELFIYDEDGVLLEHVVSGVQQQWGLNNVAFTFFGIFGAIADYEWAGIWHEVLSDANMAQLARNPYVIYEPPANTKARKLLKFVVTTPGTLSPTGIPSEEAFGTPNLTRLALYPTGIATREVHGTPHIGDVDPAGIVSAEAFGTARLLAGDLNPDGIASAEVVSDGANLIGDPSPDGTLSPSSIAGAEAMGAPTLTEVQTLHPTGIPSGFDMDNPTVRPPVGTINPFGIASEEAFADVTTTALGTPIGGTSVNGPPINPPAPAAGTVTAKKLCSPFDLILAGLYTTAASPAAILPEVYGDFSAGGLRGPIPTVLVTQSAPWIFIAAMHPVQSIDQVYVNDVLQTGGFAAIPQVALGGGPQVALIAFDEQPIGEVTWRGKGKMSSVTGALITDPILQLEDLLLTRGGYATTDFDATTLAEAKSLSAAAGWSTAFVINDTSQMQAWITEILFNVMGFWRVSGRAQLQIMIDPGGSFAQSDLVDSIVANRDVLDGDDGVTFIADRQQLVNRLVANYQYSWQEQRYTAQLADDTLLDAKSSNAYGEVRKEVTLRGHRDATQLAQWATILFARQAFETRVEGGQVEFTTKGPRLIHATVGDLFAFTWPYGPTRENGNPYVNQILRIVEISQEFTRGGATTVRAVDTGAYVQSAGSRLLTPLAV